MGEPNLDTIDRAILYHLQQNARKPINKIANAVNVSDNTVRNRIGTLEDHEVIQGYQANVDYNRAGIQHHYAFICSAPVREREGLIEQARDVPGVIELISLMTGSNNVIILASTGLKEEITEIAYQIDALGLTIEREHLIWAHDRQPLEQFRLEQTF